jgi:hypothetical protein
MKFQKKIFLLEIVLIHIGGEIGGQRRTQLLKPTVAFHNFLDLPKNRLVVTWRLEHQGDHHHHYHRRRHHRCCRRRRHHHHHPLSLLRNSLAGSLKSRGLTSQALLIHCFAKNFLTIWHILSITAFCIRMYRAEQRLRIFTLSRNL